MFLVRVGGSGPCCEVRQSESMFSVLGNLELLLTCIFYAGKKRGHANSGASEWKLKHLYLKNIGTFFLGLWTENMGSVGLEASSGTGILQFISTIVILAN